jgi:hypothetical protein
VQQRLRIAEEVCALGSGWFDLGQHFGIKSNNGIEDLTRMEKRILAMIARSGAYFRTIFNRFKVG